MDGGDWVSTMNEGIHTHIKKVHDAHKEMMGPPWEVGGKVPQQSPGKSPSSKQQGPGARERETRAVGGKPACGQEVLA